MSDNFLVFSDNPSMKILRSSFSEPGGCKREREVMASLLSTPRMKPQLASRDIQAEN